MEFAEEMEGQRKNSKVYAIGDHLYCLEKKYKGLLIVKCTHYKKSCKGRAHVEEHSLRVVEVRGDHTCNQELTLKVRLEMESKMKMLASTTGDSIRKIFDDVSLENPTVAAEIPFPRLESVMRARRAKTTPRNPTNEEYSSRIKMVEAKEDNSPLDEVSKPATNSPPEHLGDHEYDDGFKSELYAEGNMDPSDALDKETHETDLKNKWERADEEEGFLRYLGDKMKLVPRGKRVHAEIALLNTLHEFIPE